MYFIRLYIYKYKRYNIAGINNDKFKVFFKLDSKKIQKWTKINVQFWVFTKKVLKKSKKSGLERNALFLIL